MKDFISGAIVVSYLVAGLFFLRFWRDSRDRLFVFFSTAFLLLAVQRTMLTVLERTVPLDFASYSIRLLAFLMILIGIVDKNRSSA